MMSETAPTSIDLPRHSAIRFIVLLGVVDLFADMTYEGARSVTGPYLGVLGASAALVGLVAGFGEFLGYALRLVSGYLSDRTGSYWLIIPRLRHNPKILGLRHMLVHDGP